jgi:hypothetical protein
MRVAVCLCGEMRGKQDCIENLSTHVVAPFAAAGANVDLFVHTRRDAWWQSAAGLPFRMLSVEVNRPQDVRLIEGPANPKERGDRAPGGHGDRRAFLYQSYIQQYWSMYAVQQLKVRAEQEDGKPYEWVVRARPDCRLEEPVPVADLVKQSVNVPWNDWWPYEVDDKRWDTVTDKFAIGPSHSMDVYLTKILDLYSFCRRHRIQGEAFTAWQLKEHGVGYNRHDGMKIHQAADPYKDSWRPDVNG